MPERRSILPRAGNPVRPVILLLAVSFGLLLIGIPVGLYLTNFGTPSIVFVTVLILVVAIRIFGFAYRIAYSYEKGNEQLARSATWATWTIAPDQYRITIAGERTRTNRRALICATVGLVVGIIVGILQQDALLAALVIIGFLFAAAIIVTMAGPPRGSEADRLVRIGPGGVQFLGRYLPLDPTRSSSRRIGIVPGNPPVLRFSVKSGRRLRSMRVPVPPDRLADAEALVERFQRADDARPAANPAQPEP